MAGICLIRLKQVRPRGVPPFIGLTSENAAHRIAVEWTTDDGSRRSGIYIPRRDTSSLLNHLVGGRIFPGVHHRAQFDVHEAGGDYRVAIQSRDGLARILVEGHVADELPSDSLFASLDEASRFFECGSLGYSPCARPGVFDGLELKNRDWNVRPLAVTRVESSFFDDRRTFPEVASQFDCALLMTGVRHEWHSRERVSAEVGSACRAGT